jgi:hypothetical protein
MPVHLGKPGSLAAGIMISSEVGDDASNQRFEFGVPAELRGVLLAMSPSPPIRDRRVYLLA